MSTPTGQSLLHPLHARQRSSARRTSSLFHPPRDRLAGEHLEEQARPAARRVLLLAGRHVAGAHRPARRPPALADADAAKQRAREVPSVLPVRELGRRRRRRAADRLAQVLGDRVSVHDLAGVHPPLGIPDLLEPPERFDQLRPVHLREQLRARLSVAVLSRERPAVGDDEIRRFVEKPPDAGGAFLRLQVEVDPRVEAALPEVAVEVAFVAVLLVEPAQVAQVRAELLRRHRRVLPALPGQRPAGRVRRRAQRRLADPPDEPRLVRVREDPSPMPSRSSPRPAAAPSPPIPRSTRRRIRSTASRGPGGRRSDPAGRIPIAAASSASRSSNPSRPIGRCARTCGTASAAAATSGNPATRSVRAFGFGISRSVASRTVTQVPSEPASARATWNPFSGRRKGRL